MTSQSPRIYTYKITFEEVPYYYYGSKKEKYYSQEYWGSPKTNKWCWELYTPKKQILEFFEFSTVGYDECRQVEDRLIRPVLNDPWCLNERCGGQVSLSVCRKVGQKLYEEGKGIFSLPIEEKIETARKVGIKNYEEGRGWFSLTTEERIELGKKSGKIVYERKIGVHARTKEQMTEDGKKGGRITYELGLGFYTLTPEEKSELGRRNGNKIKELGLGIHGLTKEQMSENGKKGGAISAKRLNSQKWMCLETGYITNSGALSMYQKARGIDTTKRKQIS